jgi:phospholipid/cholesterol/gamma-HCH transport system substrate-binding protein
MARRFKWKDLSIGVLAAGGVIAAAVLILIFGRVGVLHGSKFTLHVTTDAARGVIRGTDVWLDGQKVGVVSGVAFQPPSVPESERLVMTLSILDRTRSRIRRDSRIQVRSGGSIIGDRVVSVSSGTATAAPIADGDTIHAREQADIEGVTSDAAIASRELPGILENVTLLTAQLRTAAGPLEALGLDRNESEVSRIRMRTERLMGQFTGGRGNAARALSGRGALQARAATAMARVDSILRLVGSESHVLGRFRRDSTLVTEIGRARDELATVQQLAAGPNGTIGRFRSDSVIMRNVHRDLAAIDSLFADIKKHPLRYIAF